MQLTCAKTWSKIAPVLKEMPSEIRTQSGRLRRNNVLFTCLVSAPRTSVFGEQQFYCNMSCSKHLDFRVSPCPQYDLSDCIDEAIVTSCRILSNNVRIPCIRYTCKVNFRLVAVIVVFISFCIQSCFSKRFF